ncbi:MAG TPA: mannose-6-phosphate isomerase, class I [Ignavibacteriales bacterium]|nr:mannose-6-phosphate isomerase, class I [Ignavibacteriales bacterium]HOL81224.1 mannose-6-phosphate isomerase, class I [Ignavibacteriales bacterium]HOM65726.1 mannose-6-phosphate isomerase, class I [Ignavibacteriales bacterium]HPD67581.1 mannose-6-phosphate isomerase, class I [Ignavibacteriales bacterium]HPP33336.1 mannose-6-phosphate isomerase, class I [Ignavibacteriales bacterium]
MELFKIFGGIRNYEWGTKNSEAFIPQILNINPEKDKPYAEYWIGTHKNLPSNIIDKNQKILLSNFIEKNHNLLGTYFFQKYNSLPFLLKILSIGEPLSIQAHPNKTQAKVLHQKDPKNYPDDNHKPEIAIAIDELKALVGIKNKENLEKTFYEFPEIKNYLNTLLDTNNAEPLDIYKSYIISSENNQLYINLTDTIYNKIKDSNYILHELYTYCYKKYGNNDIGLLSFFLLNFVELTTGEGIFLSAGIPHAYLSGNIVECMANSDNVIRVGLTPKFKDKDVLCEILKYQDNIEIFRPNENFYTYSIKEDIEFQISILQNINNFQFDTGNKFYVLLNLNDEIKICNSKQEYIVDKGEALFLPANINFTIIGNNILSFLVSVK